MGGRLFYVAILGVMALCCVVGAWAFGHSEREREELRESTQDFKDVLTAELSRLARLLRR